MNGLQLVSQLRRQRLSFPIMMLTACDAWQDKVDGLEAGADDYLVKPFQKGELLARLHALLRRSTFIRASKLTAGNYVLDIARKELSAAGEIVVLTSFEYLILECLMCNSRQMVSKQQLLGQLYGDKDGGDLNIVEVMVSRLRKKLMRHSTTSPIATIRYQGYMFTLPCYRT
ncbi:Transcriptional regulatory protein PhoP [compost metagenome]